MLTARAQEAIDLQQKNETECDKRDGTPVPLLTMVAHPTYGHGAGPSARQRTKQESCRDPSCAGQWSWNSEVTNAQLWRRRRGRVIHSNADT